MDGAPSIPLAANEKKYLSYFYCEDGPPIFETHLSITNLFPIRYEAQNISNRNPPLG